MASRLTIGESSESSKLISSPIGKKDCIIKGFKMESKISLSPSNAKRWRFKVRQACMEGPIKEIMNNYQKINK